MLEFRTLNVVKAFPTLEIPPSLSSPFEAILPTLRLQAEDGQQAPQPLPALPQWIPEPVHNGWEQLQTMPWLAAVVIVVLALIVAKITEIILCRLIPRLTAKTSTDLDDQIVEQIQRPIFSTVFYAGLALATQSLGLPESFERFTIRILFSIVVLLWLPALLRVGRLLLDGLGRLRDRFTLVEDRTIPLFDITAKLVIVGGATYALLLIWDIDATAWLASAGVVGIAVGFAAKDTLANLFSGFFIIADAPYKIGDFVVLDSGERGRVTQVGLRSTRLLTRDDLEITLPNALIANAKIINESGGPWEKERIRVKIGVAYGSDVDQVCEVLKQLAIEHDHVCAEPAPRVRFRNFGDSSLDFELLCWIDEPVLRGRLLHELNMDVYKALNKHQIEIPYPKRDVYVHQVTPSEPS